MSAERLEQIRRAIRALELERAEICHRLFMSRRARRELEAWRGAAALSADRLLRRAFAYCAHGWRPGAGGLTFREVGELLGVSGTQARTLKMRAADLLERRPSASPGTRYLRDVLAILGGVAAP